MINIDCAKVLNVFIVQNATVKVTNQKLRIFSQSECFNFENLYDIDYINAEDENVRIMFITFYLQFLNIKRILMISHEYFTA